MKWNKWLRRVKVLIAFLIPVAAVMVMNNGLDNDTWFVLAEGRETLTNGIHYTDQLSMHEGLEAVVQNYGFAAIFYLIFSVFGGIGLYIAMLILTVVLCYVIYKICMLLSNKNTNLSLLLMVPTVLLLANSDFMVTRAQVVSYILLMLVIYLMELYIRKDKTRALWLIPIISVVQINLHASVWPMIPIVMAVYMLDAIKQPRLYYKGYKVKPLMVVFVLTVLAGFLNPYGIRAMTYTITSYGIPEANNYINEMRPFDLGNHSHIILYAMIASTLILYIFGKNRRIRIRYLILLFGFLALGINTVKGMSHLILVLLFPLAEVYGDVKIENLGKRKVRWMAGSWAGLLALATICTYLVAVVPDINSEGPSTEMINAMNAVDLNVGDADKKALRVYADYNQGGYVEYRGYKSYIDPRMEVFLKANNGKEDIFIEYYDLMSGDVDEEEFLNKYNFDYMVVREGSAFYEFPGSSADKYRLVYEEDDKEDADGNKPDEIYGVKVYKKIDDTKEVFKF